MEDRVECSESEAQHTLQKITHSPVITKNLGRFFAIHNESVTLYCEYQGVVTSVEWYQHGKKIKNCSEFNIYLDKSQRKACLTIANVLMNEDSGIYTCKLFGSGTDVKCEMELDVRKGIRAPLSMRQLRVPPSPPRATGVAAFNSWNQTRDKLPKLPSPMAKELSSNIALTIPLKNRSDDRDGDPSINKHDKSQLTWPVRLFGKESSSHNSPLPGSSLEKGSILAPTSQSNQLLLPRFVVGLPEALTAPEASTVILRVNVAGAEPIEVSWYNYSTLLPKDDDYIQTNPKHGWYQLELPDVFPEDSGTWSCVAKNNHGKATSSTQLNVLGHVSPSGSEDVLPMDYDVVPVGADAPIVPFGIVTLGQCKEPQYSPMDPDDPNHSTRKNKKKEREGKVKKRIVNHKEYSQQDIEKLQIRSNDIFVHESDSPSLCDVKSTVLTPEEDFVNKVSAKLEMERSVEGSSEILNTNEIPSDFKIMQSTTNKAPKKLQVMEKLLNKTLSIAPRSPTFPTQSGLISPVWWPPSLSSKYQPDKSPDCNRPESMSTCNHIHGIFTKENLKQKNKTDSNTSNIKYSENKRRNKFERPDDNNKDLSCQENFNNTGNENSRLLPYLHKNYEKQKDESLNKNVKALQNELSVEIKESLHNDNGDLSLQTDPVNMNRESLDKLSDKNCEVLQDESLEKSHKMVHDELLEKPDKKLCDNSLKIDDKNQENKTFEKRDEYQEDLELENKNEISEDKGLDKHGECFKKVGTPNDDILEGNTLYGQKELLLTLDVEGIYTIPDIQNVTGMLDKQGVNGPSELFNENEEKLLSNNNIQHEEIVTTSDFTILQSSPDEGTIRGVAQEEDTIEKVQIKNSTSEHSKFNHKHDENVSNDFHDKDSNKNEKMIMENLSPNNLNKTTRELYIFEKLLNKTQTIAPRSPTFPTQSGPISPVWWPPPLSGKHMSDKSSSPDGNYSKSFFKRNRIHGTSTEKDKPSDSNSEVVQVDENLLDESLEKGKKYWDKSLEINVRNAENEAFEKTEENVNDKKMENHFGNLEHLEVNKNSDNFEDTEFGKHDECLENEYSDKRVDKLEEISLEENSLGLQQECTDTQNIHVDGNGSPSNITNVLENDSNEESNQKGQSELEEQVTGTYHNSISELMNQPIMQSLPDTLPTLVDSNSNFVPNTGKLLNSPSDPFTCNLLRVERFERALHVQITFRANLFGRQKIKPKLDTYLALPEKIIYYESCVCLKESIAHPLSYIDFETEKSFSKEETAEVLSAHQKTKEKMASLIEDKQMKQPQVAKCLSIRNLDRERKKQRILEESQQCQTESSDVRQTPDTRKTNKNETINKDNLFGSTDNHPRILNEKLSASAGAILGDSGPSASELSLENPEISIESDPLPVIRGKKDDKPMDPNSAEVPMVRPD